MCGILGELLVGTTFSRAVESSRFSDALSLLRRRGPDDFGIEKFDLLTNKKEVFGRLAFGHTRLAIIDLSSAGHQPMVSRDGRYVLVFNGEIYNYRELREELRGKGHSFSTSSDSEVLIAAWAEWGVGSLSRFCGMFAFVVYDQVGQSITLARDAFGIKPLFYSREKESLRFSSELPAMLRLKGAKPTVNYERAVHYLRQAIYDDSADTLIDGVFHLPPGHFLRVEFTDILCRAPERWWWPSIALNSSLSFNSSADRLRELFLDSVRMHLRSDAPIGFALSGGIDSSAIVSAARYLEPDMAIKTFTFVARGDFKNEERWADIVNFRCGAIGHKIVIDDNEVWASLDQLCEQQGEPFRSSSIFASHAVYNRVHQEGLKVTLDGQGGDEVLAGYDGYPGSYIRSLLEGWELGAVHRYITALGAERSQSATEAVLLACREMAPAALRPYLKRLIGRGSSPSWLNSRLVTSSRGIRGSALAEFPGPEGYRRRLVEALRRSQTHSSLQSLLRHGDRCSMWFGVESRVPFLTTGLSEYLLSLPEKFLVSQGGRTKHIFRHAMRGIVPEEILNRSDKVGFETPESAWATRNTELIMKLIDSSPPSNLIDKAKLRSVVERDANEGNFSPASWRAINFLRWTAVFNLRC